MKNLVRLEFRLSEKLKKQVFVAAKRRDISVSQFVQQALEEFTNP